MPIKKDIFEYFLLFSTYDYWFNYLSYTIFPRRKHDLVVRHLPFWWKGLIFFPIFFFPFMNKMDGIETFLGNFFKLHDLERNELSLGRIKNGSLNHVPQGRRGTTSWQEGGTIFLGEQLFECLTRKYKDKICANQMFFISLKSFQNIHI
jgi:hypothetical protein